MDAYLVGVRDMDDVFKGMLEAKQVCERMDLSYPKEVAEYFGECLDESESEIRRQMQHALVVALGAEGPARPGKGVSVEAGSGDMDRWVEFDLSDIPSDVKRLRLTLDFD